MPREKNQQLLEVHVAGICYRETNTDIEVLVAKRREDRDLYPGKWETGAGQVRSGENFEEAIQRQIADELGIKPKKVVVFRTYQVDTPSLPQKKIPGVMFVCLWNKYLNDDKPKISQEEFTEWKWQSLNHLNEIDLVPGLAKDIRTGWEVFSAINKIKDIDNQEKFETSKF
jgi:8-oxo-dGTP pyrophosphatase MutT (NUDIX family)